MNHVGVRIATIGALLCTSRAATAVDVPTIYDNMHMFPVGSRAAGMGGAYTALGCDEAALHYNPAALGCAGSSRLELAANVYMIQSMSVPDAFGEGQDIDAITYHSIPSIVGGVRVLRDPDDEHGSGRVVFGLNVAVPHSLALKVDPSQPDQPNFLQVRVRDALTAGDVGVGWQINRYISLGVSLGAALRTFEAAFSSLFTDTFLVPCLDPVGCRSFVHDSLSQEALAVGGRGKIGARFTPIESLSLGLAVTSPSLDIWGSSNIVTVATVGVGDGAGGAFFNPFPARLEGDSDLSLPFRLALGVAYTWPRFTLSFDASLNFPHTANAAYDFEQTRIEGVAPLSDADMAAQELHYARRWQPNFNLGGEIGVTDTVVVDLGAFTDISAVSKAAIEARAQDRVHMFGGTVALGLLGKHARGWFGLSFEYGRGTSRVLEGELNLSNIALNGVVYSGQSPITRWTLAGFIGSNYSFLSDDEEDEEQE